MRLGCGCSYRLNANDCQKFQAPPWQKLCQAVATFQALPGASFVVNGAAQASDSALTTASAEMRWINGCAAAATFEGEFPNVTRSYAGKGVVRYAW